MWLYKLALKLGNKSRVLEMKGPFDNNIVFSFQFSKNQDRS